MIKSEGVKIVIQITSNSNEGSSTISGFDNSRKRKLSQDTTIGNGAKKPCPRPPDSVPVPRFLNFPSPPRDGDSGDPSPRCPPLVKIEPDDGLKIIKLTELENDEPTPGPALQKTDTKCVRSLLSSIQYRVTLLSE